MTTDEVTDFRPTLERTEDDEQAEQATANAGSKAVAIYDSRAPRLHMGEPAYKQFSKAMLAIVANTIMPPNYTLPELYMGLEVAATYGLDVLTRELWLVRMKDGGPVVPLVGRDGLLAIAERHSDFVGFRNRAVYENDEFEELDELVERDLGNGVKVMSEIRHKSGKPTERGALVGAFAEAYRKGRPPVSFFAELSEYERGTNTPWGKQKTAMIRKCALANALRLAYRISGLYIADEMSGALLERVQDVANSNVDVEVPAAGPLVENPQIAAWLDRLFRAANNLTPGSWLPAKQRLHTAGKTAEELSDLIGQLEEEIRAAGGEPPPPPLAEEPESGPIDGEVQEEPRGSGECDHPADKVTVDETGDRYCNACDAFIGPEVSPDQERLGI